MEVEIGYWFYVAGHIYVTTSFKGEHPVIGRQWNVVGLDGEETWLSERSIIYADKA